MRNEEARALLLELGKTEGAVAANLKLLGHKGERGNNCRCPVARYLLAHGAPTIMVTALSGVVLVSYRPGAPRVSLPRPVASFVMAFDRGEYPELDLEAA